MRDISATIRVAGSDEHRSPDVTSNLTMDLPILLGALRHARVTLIGVSFASGVTCSWAFVPGALPAPGTGEQRRAGRGDGGTLASALGLISFSCGVRLLGHVLPLCVPRARAAPSRPRVDGSANGL